MHGQANIHHQNSCYLHEQDLPVVVGKGHGLYVLCEVGTKPILFAGLVIRLCVLAMIRDFSVCRVAHQMNEQFSELHALQLLVAPQLPRAGIMQSVH